MRTETEKQAGSYILRNYGQFFKKQYQDFVYLSSDVHPLEENKTYTPIQVIMTTKESTSVTSLVASDNTIMTKVLGVLSSLCVEISSLKAEGFERHFPFLSVYDEYSGSSISSEMESICQLSAFTSRCNDTLLNLCMQVFAVVTEGLINLNGIQWHYIVKNIGEAFTILVLLEQLIANSLLPSNWNKFAKTVKTSSVPDTFDLCDVKLKSITGAIDAITIKLMNDDIVQNFLHTLLTARKKYLSGKYMSLISSEFTSYIKHAIGNLDKLIQEKPNLNNMYRCIKVNTLYVLSSHLYGSNDKKIFKTLIELNTKAHSVPIMGTVIWFPEQFLQRHVPSQCANYSKLPQTLLKARQTYISCTRNTLTRDIMNLQSICSQWVLDVEETFSCHNNLSAAEMSRHAKTILDGLDAASGIHLTVLTFINLHISLGIPLSKNMLILIFNVLDLLKCLKNAVNRNYNQILLSNTMIIQHLVFQASSSILEIKKTLMCDKKYANKRLDELTCIVIAERVINGAATNERNIAANVALSFVPEATYLEDSYSKLGTLLEKVEILTNFPNSMEQYCNCSWMLWHQNIFPLYFEQNLSNHLNAVRLRYFLMVLEDCAVLLHKTDKQFGLNKFLEFTKKITSIIDISVLNDVSQNIETNLRLHIHSHLQLDVINPLAFDMIKKILLAIDILRNQIIYMAVVPFVEHYLSKTYYNLTTVVLSDWKTYGEMRQMAKFKFNLSTIQDNLPTQTLEQGLDVLEIMRNIHIFVSKYQYNLNNQIFIEKSSNNKHLNTINIRHIANSIRTHGTGVMNTTVNFTYQFLKNKFFTFSQFMYDEQIKSRLIKDMRNFKENISAHGTGYPYKNAEKFNKGIKILGLDEDGQSYLDLFRDLVSQIGNAIGYVRMIRSGGRHCCADATAFLPNLEITKIIEVNGECIIGDKVTEAAENFHDNVNGLISNFIQGTEYFKLLVDVFAPVFRNPKNLHLKNFYIIVPPLTFNFVEHMILSKDKMYKKNKVGASFTDDGFAMGIAYILKLLDQDCNFESLDWFDSVWNHIKSENQIIEEQKSKGSLQLQQALALTEKKIKTLEEEYKLLYYSLTSARIFFR